jgi:competence protein ComEC
MTYNKIKQIKSKILILFTILILQQNFTIKISTRNSLIFLPKEPKEAKFLLNKLKTKNTAKLSFIMPKLELYQQHFSSVFTQESDYFKDNLNISVSSRLERVSRIVTCLKGLLETTKSIIYSSIYSLKYRFFSFQNFALNLRQKLIWLLEGNFTTREATLGKAFVFADLSGAPETIYHSFKVIGILHLIAASSANIYLILSFFGPVMAFLEYFFGQKGLAFFKSLIIIIYYLLINGHFILVDGSPSILRAALSCILAIVANHYFNLKVKALNLLVLVGIIILFINPFYLQSLGFQLSFLASFIILFYWPYIKKKIAKSSIMFSFTVQFALWPVLILYFSNINFIAIPANILLSSLVEFLTVLYFTFIAFKAVHLLFFADFISNLIYFVNNIFFKVLAFLEKMPAKSIDIYYHKTLIISFLLFIQLVFIFLILFNKKHLLKKNKYRIFFKWPNYHKLQ